MKYFILLCVFCVSFDMAWSQVPSNPNPPTELLINYNSDIYKIAAQYMNMSGPPLSNQIDIPLSLYNDILGAMAAVYQAYCIPERDTVFDIRCIHQGFSYYVVGTNDFYVECLIGAFGGTWSFYNTTTWNQEVDSLFDLYDVTITDIQTYQFSPNLMTVTFHTPHPVNIKALMNRLDQALGSNVLNIYDNPYMGDSSEEIYYESIGSDKILKFQLGWGDCLAGCIYNADYRFKVNPSYLVTYLGFFNPSNETPPTYYSNCNITQAPLFVADTISVCDSIWMFNQWLIPNSIFLEQGANSSGQDSLTYHFVLANGITDTILAQVFACDSFIDLKGNVHYQSSFFQNIIDNTAGCDSIVDFNLTIHYSSESFAQLTVCGSYLGIDNQLYIQSGLYDFVLTNQEGCDSVLHLQLDVHPAYDTLIIVQECGKYIGPDNQLLTQSGVYSYAYQPVNYCDSTITLDLTIYPLYETHIMDSICPGDSIIWDGQPIDSAGIYQHTLYSQHGCDSVITLTLSQLPVISIQFNSFPDTLWVNDTLFNLEGSALPAGGIFVGNGVNTNMLNMVEAGVGEQSLIYQYVSSDGCLFQDTVDFYISETIGIDYWPQTDIKLFPNPATDHVRINGLEQGDNYQLINIWGDCLLSRHADATSLVLSLRSIPSGIYFMQIHSKSGSLKTTSMLIVI